MREDVLVTCRCGAGDLDILPFWLEHYSGFRRLVSFMWELGGDMGGEGRVPEFFHRHEFACRDHLVDRYVHEETKRLWKADVLEVCSGPWSDVRLVVSLDADEFISPERVGCVTAPPWSGGGRYVGGIMVDRFPEGGYLDVPPAKPLDATYPVRAEFVKEVMGGYTYKTLVTGPENACSVHDRPAGKMSCVVEIEHYKWRLGTIARMEKRAGDCDAAGVPWGAGVRKALALVKTEGGRPYLDISGCTL